MARVTPGFKLYLYQLLSRELGVGKQTMLPQVEEVLARDDIKVEDFECATLQELVEACPDFMKLTIFKKGRAYATIVRNEEWDQMLAAPEEKPAPQKKAAAGGPKTWKKKKGSKKTLKPVKPGKQRREREAAEAREAAAAEEERLRAEAEAREAEAAETAAGGEATADAGAAKQQEEPTTGQAPAQVGKALAAEGATAPEAAAAETAPSTARTLAEILAEARAAEAKQAEANSADHAPNAAVTAQPASAEPSAPVAAPAPEPAPELAAAPAPVAATGPQAPTAPESAAAPQAPAAPEPAPISLTITYDPYEEMERELERQARENPPKPTRPAPASAKPAGGAAVPAIPLRDLPQDFGGEVSCKDALLRALYQLLPYDVDPMAVLDEDWRMARSTGSLSGSRNRVTFPLRYLHEDGTPITATLRKTTKSSFGKQWILTLVDGDDGTGVTHVALGFEGLPSADEGAWSDLSGRTTDVSASPIRTLASQVVLGTWDAFLGALSTMAAPERWNYPGEGVGKASRYGILREYVATTFARVQQQERVATSSDGSFAAFHTGLATPLGDAIYACLTKRTGDIPWQFAGFATAGSGELGARLTGTIAELPHPATYLASLDDVMVDAQRMVILDTEAILGRQLGRLPRAFLLERLDANAEAREILAQSGALSSADLTHLTRVIKADASAYRRIRRALDDAVEQTMQACQASYRLAAPVFDPADSRTKLLVPLCLVEDGTADCALVLDLQPSGAYRAAAILPLPRAYACARVVSREQPEWLAARRVL